MSAAEKLISGSIPSKIDSDEILQIIHHSNNEENKVYFKILKNVSNEDDKLISSWLDMNEKTYRSYRSQEKTVKPSLLEHAVMIISLFKHGAEIFGNSDQFKKWLFTDNFHFDKKQPIDFIYTISGIKFIDDRLTGIEYGDNA